LLGFVLLCWFSQTFNDFSMSTASDVYSFGIIMHEMLTFKIPFEECVKSQVCQLLALWHQCLWRLGPAQLGQPHIMLQLAALWDSSALFPALLPCQALLQSTPKTPNPKT